MKLYKVPFRVLHAGTKFSRLPLSIPREECIKLDRGYEYAAVIINEGILITAESLPYDAIVSVTDYET